MENIERKGKWIILQNGRRIKADNPRWRFSVMVPCDDGLARCWEHHHDYDKAKKSLIDKGKGGYVLDEISKEILCMILAPNALDDQDIPSTPTEQP